MATVHLGCRLRVRAKGLAESIALGSGLALLAFALPGCTTDPHVVSRQESRAIGNVRSVIALQAAYQAANGGLYEGDSACLSVKACIPPRAGVTPSMAGLHMTEAFEVTPSHGYLGRLLPGPRPSPFPAGISPTSVVAYAYVAAPSGPNASKQRTFCGDATGVICFTRDGRTPQVTPGGLCDLQFCEPLQ